MHINIHFDTPSFLNIMYELYFPMVCTDLRIFLDISRNM